MSRVLQFINRGLIGLCILFLCRAALAAESRPATNAFPEVQNTQKETIPPISAEEALKRITLPEGFRATLFAAEPQVRNPIGAAFDSCGRLWLAENYTYAEREVGFDARFRDRVVILEDADGDGQAEKRTVFWDRGDRLTSVLPTSRGAYVLCAPKLLFIPDKNGDDIPDGEPEVLLDGFEERSVRHNLANGLKWGPDGWLYGRHGILATSHAGKPGTPREQRAEFNCSMWRFHPTTHAFEVIAHGTTNPWGHDWDDYGQLFFINTVIGHLWHVVPGAFYKRMYGEHPNPHLYELIDQTANHVHWATNEKWEDIRKGVTDATVKAGGGHAHSGFMIYLGDNWPEEHRNAAFTVNYHGRRLNQDRLERRGGGYTAHHASDVVTFGDPWFRGVELFYGPDGGVYVLDWSDIGECHDDDGVHRSSGRIFKIVYGEAKPKAIDLAKLSNAELVKLQLHHNDWLVRQARDILRERLGGASHTSPKEATHKELRALFEQQSDPRRKLRALWCLYVTGGAPETWLRSLLKHENEHIRTWAVQLLVDQGPPADELLAELSQMARTERSGLVLSFLTSVLRKLEFEKRWPLAEALASHGEFADDRTLPLLLWYGIEPAIASLPNRAVALASGAGMSKVRSFAARRITSELDSQPEAVDNLVAALGTCGTAVQQSILAGMAEALRGWRKAEAPKSWARVSPALLKSGDEQVRKLAEELAVVFGDGRAVDSLRAVVADTKADLNVRRRALQTLVQSRADALLPVLRRLLAEMEIAPNAIRAMAGLGLEETPDVLLHTYPRLRSYTAKMEAINALASRAAFARELLDAVERKAIPAQNVGALQIRQLRSLGDLELNKRIAALWPEHREINTEKQGQIVRWREQLTTEQIAQGDAVHGRALFGQLCGTCHTLFGEGAAIAPDLTGSDRKNVDFLLNNIVDPSGVVAENYRVSTIRMKDERVINGVVGAKTDRTLTVQTPTEKLVLERREIESVTESEFSIMPEGLLDSLKPEDVRDLMAYLTATGPPPREQPTSGGQVGKAN